MRWLSTLLCTFALTAPVQGIDGEERTLFIAVDAVPFETMREVAERPESAFFRSLEGPVPVISTFPSSTSLALGAILQPMGVEPSPGYEAKFYSWETNEQTGGGLISYEPFPWRSFFDWKVHTLWRKATSAMKPIKAAKKDIRQSLTAFMNSEASSYFIYYDTTDSAGHLKSPEGLKPILAELDLRLRELRESSPDRPFRTVIFSDHGLSGGVPLINTRKSVKRALRGHGYRSTKKLGKDRSVVFVPFGLLSSFIAYTRPGEEEDVVAAITAAEGVDLCAYRQGEGWRIGSRRGAATLRYRASPPAWAYEWTDGDPLSLDDDLAGRFAKGEWIPDDELFTSLRSHHYPDPFHRIARAFDLVANPASIACSVEAGYMYGSKLTATSSRLSVGRLKWTHGSLGREASLGFLMTDSRDWKADGPVRFDQVLAPFQALSRELPVPASH